MKTHRISLIVVLVLVAACVLSACRGPQEVEYEPAVAPVAPPRVEDGKVRAAFAFPTGEKATSVLLVEKIAPAEVQVGRAFEYEIHVTNLVDCELDDVTIVDRLPKSFEMQTSQPQVARMDGAEAGWDLGTLKSKEARVILVKGIARGAGSMTHCAKVVYRTPLCLTVSAVEPKLELSRSAPAESLVCDTIPARWVVTNIGTGTAYNAKVQETLPEGLMTDAGDRKLMFDAGDLAVGQSREFSAGLKAARTGAYQYKAMAMADGDLTAQAQAATRVRQPVLVIAKTSPKRIYLGRSITYDISVMNKGDVNAQNVVVQDPLPTGTTFISATGGGELTDGVVSWNVGDLAVGASRDMKVTMRADTIRTLENTVKATAVCAKPVMASATTSMVGIPAILLEVVDLEDPIEVGANETYVIMATNQGTAPATNVAIVCELEDSMQYVSSEGATDGAIAGRTVTFAPLPSLKAKAKATWKVVVKAAKEGDVRFTVMMTSDQLERPVQETEATNFYE